MIFELGLIATYTLLGFATLWWTKQAIEMEMTGNEGHTLKVKVGAVLLWPVIIVLVALSFIYLNYREIRYGEQY